MRDYTKAGYVKARGRRALPGLLICLLAVSAFGPRPGAAENSRALRRAGTPWDTPVAFQPPETGLVGVFDFSDWHFPVPAGDWIISRGPCRGGGLFHHQCGYFEDECALDIIPVVGSMMSVPILAPQAGQVFFLGTRTDSGLAVLLQHADGRISAMMHLSKVVVELDQRVAQGQVIGYAGSTGNSGRPHVHFDVQVNAVERSCLPLSDIDESNTQRMTLRSHNLPWSALVLPDPPPTLPAWLPLLGLDTDLPSTLMPARVVLGPAMAANVPIAVSNTYLGSQRLQYAGQVLTATVQTNGYTLFNLRIEAPSQPGDYYGSLEFHVAGPVTGASPVPFHFQVREPANSSAAGGLVWINPRLVGPPDYSVFSSTPKLCVTEPAVAGPAPFTFRVMVAGSAQADSGWMPAECWMPPALAQGTYYWKVFVRDGSGHMNRTNDRPHIFKIQ